MDQQSQPIKNNGAGVQKSQLSQLSLRLKQASLNAITNAIQSNNDSPNDGRDSDNLVAFKSVLSAIKHPMALFSVSFMCLFCNQAFEQYVGLNTPLTGSFLHDIFQDIAPQALDCLVTSQAQPSTTTSSSQSVPDLSQSSPVSIRAKPVEITGGSGASGCGGNTSSRASIKLNNNGSYKNNSLARRQSDQVAGIMADEENSGQAPVERQFQVEVDGVYSVLSIVKADHYFLVNIEEDKSYSQDCLKVASDRGSLSQISSPLSQSTPSLSRYKNEFTELECLGKGAYGVVYRAINRIDGMEYAIKKIKLKTSSDPAKRFYYEDKLLREVQAFARISDHPNVLRYYSAWTECAPVDYALSNQQVGDAVMSSHFSDEDDDFGFNAGMPHVDSGDGESLFFNSFVPSLVASSSASSSNQHRQLQLSNSAPQSRFNNRSYGKLSQAPKIRSRMASHDVPGSMNLMLEQIDRRPSCPAYEDHTRNNRRKKPKIVSTLYLQMQLCNSKDLRWWLSARNALVDVNQSLQQQQLIDVLSLFRQIVDAVQYIHAKGFVHRDIKPENIFVENNTVYLSDFGLTKAIIGDGAQQQVSAHQRGSLAGNNIQDKEGTYIYMAPNYNAQSPSTFIDIYAMGVVFIELLKPFRTGMERAVVLTQVRKGILPDDLKRNYPQLFTLIEKMVTPSNGENLDAANVLTEIEQLLQSIKSPSPAQTPSVEKSQLLRSSISSVTARLGRRWSSNDFVREKFQSSLDQNTSGSNYHHHHNPVFDMDLADSGIGSSNGGSGGGGHLQDQLKKLQDEVALLRMQLQEKDKQLSSLKANT
ncbi:hypothetical protein MP228_006361 [Amoeboaphelidium protococcarum]|nr:hypothetical protein MP228_006361 [Amoeboaphelidium protococcarum]